MHALLAWWTLVIAKLGAPATLLLLLYLTALVWLLVDVARGLSQQLRYQLVAKRRLRKLHRRPVPSRVVSLTERVDRRRADVGAHDAAS